jgi:hypothetical protein
MLFIAANVLVFANVYPIRTLTIDIGLGQPYESLPESGRERLRRMYERGWPMWYQAFGEGEFGSRYTYVWRVPFLAANITIALAILSAVGMLLEYFVRRGRKT